MLEPAPGATSSARRLLGVALFLAAGVLLWRLSDLLVAVFGAIVLAVALRALASSLERLGIGERWSLFCTLLVVVGVLAVIGALAGGPLADQLAALRQRLPDALKALMEWAHSHSVGRLALQVWEDTKQDGMPWERLAGLAGLTLGLLGDSALILIMGVYLAAAPRVYRGGLLRLLPLPYRAPVGEALFEAADGLRRWLLGQAISMAFVGTAMTLGLWWLSVPLPLAIGLIAGLLGFIPFFGALAGGLLAVLIAFMQGPTAALHVALLCLAIQQVEGHLLSPLVQRWAVQLPPVLSIAAAVVFGVLFGIVGVLFATPMMVVGQILLRRLYVEEFLERPRG